MDMATHHPERRKNEERRKQYTAPALSKGLDIIELLAAESDGLMLKEIADSLGRSKGEIFRMLVVLEQRAYVALVPGSEKYNLTLKIFKLAHQHPHINRLTKAAAPFMSNLSRIVEQSCHLVIYSNGRGLVIAQQNSPTNECFAIRLGTVVPLNNTCSGHLLLTYSHPKKREEMLLEQPALIKMEISKSNLKIIIERIRKQGYESVPSEQIKGVKDIGYPIFDYSGNIVAALVVPFMEHIDGSQTVNFDETKKVIREKALSLSKSLGYMASS